MKNASEIVKGALDRARERVALAHYVTTNAVVDVYSVSSATDPDVAYTVTVGRGEVYRCSCPSGSRPACWHRASVYMRRANDRARMEWLQHTGVGA